MAENMFEVAVREKYRFPYKGQISVEDLWDLPGTQLDVIYKALNAEKKVSEEDSLISTHSKAEIVLQTKIDIVKYVYAKKLEEAAVRKQKAANAEEKRRIMELIANKEDAALAEKSVDELKKMLAELED